MSILASSYSHTCSKVSFSLTYILHFTFLSPRFPSFPHLMLAQVSFTSPLISLSFQYYPSDIRPYKSLQNSDSNFIPVMYLEFLGLSLSVSLREFFFPVHFHSRFLYSILPLLPPLIIIFLVSSHRRLLYL